MQWMGTHHKTMRAHDLTLFFFKKIFKGLCGLDDTFSKVGRLGLEDLTILKSARGSGHFMFFFLFEAVRLCVFEYSSMIWEVELG